MLASISSIREDHFQYLPTFRLHVMLDRIRSTRASGFHNDVSWKPLISTTISAVLRIKSSMTEISQHFWTWATNFFLPLLAPFLSARVLTWRSGPPRRDLTRRSGGRGVTRQDPTSRVGTGPANCLVDVTVISNQSSTMSLWVRKQVIWSLDGKFLVISESTRQVNAGHDEKVPIHFCSEFIWGRLAVCSFVFNHVFSAQSVIFVFIWAKRNYFERSWGTKPVFGKDFWAGPPMDSGHFTEPAENFIAEVTCQMENVQPH